MGTFSSLPEETLRDRGDRSPESGHAHAVPCDESIASLPLISIGFLVYNNSGALLYNCKETLIRGLDCLVHQDYPHKELIIFDDCSTDGTYEICQEYAERFPFIRLFRNEKNVGTTENFQKLLLQVHGEYFLWACPDDVYDLTFLSKCAGAFMQNPAAVIATSAIALPYDTGETVTYRFGDFCHKLPFVQMAKQVIKSTNARGEIVGYNAIIHTLVRSSFLSRICAINQFFACEQLWIVNALIWGDVAYVDEVLFAQSVSTTPLEVRNPHVHAIMTQRLSSVKHAFKYLFHFLKRRNIPWQKKKLYVIASYFALRYYSWPPLYCFFKSSFIFGVIKYDQKFLGGRLRKAYKMFKKLRYGTR